MDGWHGDKHRPGRKNQGLRDIAEAAGYLPGEFSVSRFADDAKLVKGWLDDLRVGQVPDDFMGVNLSEASKIINREANALVERERAWLPFFYPTMKAEQVSGTMKHEHEHDHRHTHESVSETSAWLAETLGTDEESEAQEPRTN